jgi:hypothetical protein
MQQQKILDGTEMATIFATTRQILKEKTEDSTAVFHLQSNFNVFLHLN